MSSVTKCFKVADFVASSTKGIKGISSWVAPKNYKISGQFIISNP